jgi:hypothetical protein
MKKTTRVRHVLIGVASAALAGMLLAAPCLGQPAPAGAVPGESNAAVPPDPVAAAFSLPYGVILNDRQRSEYDRLRAEKEPELRAAVDSRRW